MGKDILKKELIQSLSTQEAFQVLLIYLKENPTAEEAIYKIAMDILSDFSIEKITDHVFNALNLLNTEDLFNRSGGNSYGYTDPNEESWVMFEEELELYISEMKKFQERNMPEEAKKYCVGIIKGLQKYDEESTSEFHDWVQDAPDNFISDIFHEWKNMNPQEDIDELKKMVYDL